MSMKLWSTTTLCRSFLTTDIVVITTILVTVMEGMAIVVAIVHTVTKPGVISTKVTVATTKTKVATTATKVTVTTKAGNNQHHKEITVVTIQEVGGNNKKEMREELLLPLFFLFKNFNKKNSWSMNQLFEFLST